jgi:hypothetical protein
MLVSFEAGAEGLFQRGVDKCLGVASFVVEFNLRTPDVRRRGA